MIVWQTLSVLLAHAFLCTAVKVRVLETKNLSLNLGQVGVVDLSEPLLLPL